jgi:hypothetical protein
MGLSITAMLASIASDIVIAGNLPYAKELTWFQKFSLMTSIFTFLALIESVIVLYFFYSKSEDMVPKVTMEYYLTLLDGSFATLTP